MHGREFRRFRVAAVDFHFIERVAPLRGTPESEHSDVAGLLQRQRDRLFAALRVLRFRDVAPRAAVVRELQFVGCGVGVLPAEHDFGEGAALAQVDLDPLVVAVLARPAARIVAVGESPGTCAVGR